MKKSLLKWQISGIVFTVAFGVILHFLYEWTNKSVFVAPFSGVNESTWEHMKLLFFPMVIFAIVESFFFKEYQSFWNIKFKGIVLGLLLIPLLFYFYNGVIGKSPDWINIGIFIISVCVTYIFEIKLFKKKESLNEVSNSYFFLVITIGILFVLFTFYQPKIEIFKDPNTNLYGINNFVNNNI